MASLSVRNLTDRAHRALKARAAARGRSVEAEARAILTEAVLPKERVRVGSELRTLGARLGGLDPTPERDPTPLDPARFE